MLVLEALTRIRWMEVSEIKLAHISGPPTHPPSQVIMDKIGGDSFSQDYKKWEVATLRHFQRLQNISSSDIYFEYFRLPDHVKH